MKTIKRLSRSIMLPASFCVVGPQTVLAQEVTPICGSKDDTTGCGKAEMSISGKTMTITVKCGGTAPTVNVAAGGCTAKGGPVFDKKTGTWSVKEEITKTAVACRGMVTITVGKESCKVDPLNTTLTINTGHMAIQTFKDVPKGERFISVTNGDPGLKQLEIRSNGRLYKNLELSASTVNVDGGRVMTEQDNTISFIGRGPTGSFANIIVGDTPPAAAATRKAQARGIWGPLVDSAEDNDPDQLAIAASQQIRLNLETSLDLNSARSTYHYQVAVNGSPVQGVLAAASQNADGTALVLTLPKGSFVSGDAIEVSWSGLKNAAGQLLSGNVDLTAE
jgi:hypothetical protein